jgi:hypothetical protein
VLQLREFDLQLAFMAFGAQGEYVQDQAAAVHHAALEAAFKVALLTWRQFMIEHHDIRFVQAQHVTDFGDLALAGKQRRIGLAPACPIRPPTAAPGHYRPAA